MKDGITCGIDDEKGAKICPLLSLCVDKTDRWIGCKTIQCAMYSSRFRRCGLRRC
jgi:hypothetical protein